MNDIKIRQQIVDKIKSSTNILVTVSTDPSVDALSAALALTVMLNRLDKHATAVFSGAIPPAISFLEPEATFESTTDSLRDFIIALDKSKADHLRYKVEGDVVKIFITPYRTTISDKDLEFSQGDYNVELVLALGVDNQDHLDSALEAHGRILHDATVATLTAGTQTSSLGSLDWHDDSASSLSEMLMGLVESLATPQDEEPLLDQQTATAILTGIVAETDRFSNPKTSAKVMTVAAQLMAAGADQQLIASKLQDAHQIGQTSGLLSVGGAPATTLDQLSDQAPASMQGGLSIEHSGETLEQITNSVKADEPVVSPVVPEPTAAPLPPITLSNAYAPEPDPMAPAPAPVASGPRVIEPLSQPAEPVATDEEPSAHAYLSDAPSYGAPINGTAQAAAETAPVDIFAADPAAAQATPTSAYAPDPAIESQPVVTTPQPAPAAEPVAPPVIEPLSDMAQNRDEASRDDALAAVHATFDAAPAPQPFMPAPGIVLPQPPPLPDFSAMDPAAPAAPTAPERLGDIFAPEPAAPTTAPVDNPGQFKIPGQ